MRTSCLVLVLLMGLLLWTWRTAPAEAEAARRRVEAACLLEPGAAPEEMLFCVIYHGEAAGLLVGENPLTMCRACVMACTGTGLGYEACAANCQDACGLADSAGVLRAARPEGEMCAAQGR